MAKEGKELSEFCKECIKNRVAMRDGEVDEDTGEPVYSKGDFIINCTGIPANDKFIPQEDKLIEKLSKNHGQPLTLEQIEEIKSNYDPVRWGAKYLNWKPRRSRDGIRYQEMILHCSSKRKVMRCGRRLGKSESLIVLTLFNLFTNSPNVKRWDREKQEWVNGFSKIMFIAPYLSQVKDFFKRLRKKIYDNEYLASEVDQDVSTPYYMMRLKSGMELVGFSAGSSGAESLRGHAADIIILDEMDYLDAEAIDAIMALLMEHGDVDLFCASTPSGRREFFYQFCKEDMMFKEFHYTSKCNPNWSKRMEMELRKMYRTETAWLQEILADFGESTGSVFQFRLISAATQRYSYENEARKEGCLYAIGCDWNDTENGTKIRVLEYDPKRMKLRQVDVATVQKAGWTQTTAVNKIVEMNRKWICDYIYVDDGYGAMQTEVLRKIGHDAQFRRDDYAHIDMRLMDVKGINFSSKIEIFDPISKLPKREPMKPYMVESVVRKFETGAIEVSSEDESLIKQLTGYSIAKVSANGQKVYEAGPAGDHDLDAFMLSVLAFEIELSQFTNKTHDASISVSGRIGSSGVTVDVMTGTVSQSEGASVKPRKPEGRSEVITITPTIGLGRSERIYTPESFNRDERRVSHKHSATAFVRTPHLKGGTRRFRSLSSC